MPLNKNYLILFIGVAISGSLLYFYFDPSYNKIFPPCPFYTLTHLYCPGCGSQRAFHDLLHGDIISASGHNLLFVASLPLVAYSGVISVFNVFVEKKVEQRFFSSPAFATGVLIAVLLFAVLRNIPVMPLLWLAP